LPCKIVKTTVVPLRRIAIGRSLSGVARNFSRLCGAEEFNDA
jgi:hypothetical protein